MNTEVNGELHQAVAAAVNEEAPVAVLGWVLIVEMVDANGHRTLHRYDRAADGGRLASWQRAGYLHEALNVSWRQE